MSHKLVADAGPLIALARIGHLELLERLFGRVMIPPVVSEELRLDSCKPGAAVLSQALDPDGWIRIEAPGSEKPSLRVSLGEGEAEAIALASEHGALLLIDERRGRRAARAAGVQVLGTGRVLIAAKDKGYLSSVSVALDELCAVGYRLSGELVRRLTELAGES